MEAGRNTNLLKLDVEMFRQKSLISDQEAPRARSDDGLIFETKRNSPETLSKLLGIFISEQQELLNLIEKQDANEVRGFFI